MNSVVLLVVLPFAGALVALVGKVTHAERVTSVLAALCLAAMVVPLVLTFPAVWENPGPGSVGVHSVTTAVQAAGDTPGPGLVYQLGGWPEPYGIALYLDGLAWLSSALVVVISTLVALASFSSRAYRAHYFFFLLLLVAGMEIVVLTGDIFTMFVAFEIVAIAAYVLIAFDRTDEGLLASLKYLLLSSVGILFFLFGVFLIYRDFGSLSLAVIRDQIAAGTDFTETTSIHLAVAALCVGIGVRTAFIPFHTWLPEAHAYAPHPVSAILSGVLIKVSFLAMIRLIATFRADYLNNLLLWIGAITSVVAVVWALSQRDAKRLLAYHSISQMGYILAAFGAAATLSATALYAHALHHALFKSLLFLVAGAAIHMTGERDLFRMPAVGRRAPALAIAFLAGALSIAGIPPFNGFASKQLISSALAGHPAYILLWITAVGTTASFIKASRIVIPFGRPHADVETQSKPGVLLQLSVTILALLTMATGIFARPLAALYARLLGPAAGSAGEAVHTLDPASRAAAGTQPAEAAAGTLQAWHPFAADKLLGTLPIVAAGVVLYLLLMSRAGHAVAHRIEGLAPQLRTVLLFFVLGLGLFAAVAYL